MAATKDSKHKTTLGVVDVVAGAVFFLLLCFLIKAGLDRVVPGLLTDRTLIQVVISGLTFLGVWALLGTYVFQPYLGVIEEREARTVGDEKKAQERLRETRQLNDTIEAELRTARVEGIRARDIIIEKAKKQSSKITDLAAGEADAKMKAARAEIEGLTLRTRAEVSGEVEQLASVVRERVLNSPAGNMMH